MVSENQSDTRSKLLIVDDEKSILRSLARTFRGPQYSVTTTSSPREAINLLAEKTFDVVLSDMRMPELNGSQVLAQAAKLQPDSVRLLLTGYADLESTISAINQGSIYKYISKPWNNFELRDTVELAIEKKANKDKEKASRDNLNKGVLTLKKTNSILQKRIKSKSSELEQSIAFYDVAREELAETCKNTIKSFASSINQHLGVGVETLEFFKARIRDLALSLELEENEVEALEYAVMLHQIGKLKIDKNLQHMKVSSMSKKEYEAYCDYAKQSVNMLIPFENMSMARKAIQCHLENYNGTGFPEKLFGEQIPLPARLLRVIVDCVYWIDREKRDLKTTLKTITAGAGYQYDPVVVEALSQLLLRHEPDLEELQGFMPNSEDLPIGSVLAEDVICQRGTLILTRGTQISQAIVEKIKLFEKINQEKLLIKVKTSEPI